MYIYEGHMGSLYVTDYPLEYEELYCETCGDSDWLIGYAETREEAWNLLEDEYYDYEYIKEFIDSNWDE